MVGPDLQQPAREHLWLHFTRMGGFGPGQDVPIIVKGDGCYLWDANGKRYLDALAGLFSVNIGYAHGITFGGHPVMCAIALKNIEIMKRERIVEHVRDTEGVFRAKLETLLDVPIVGDVRGTGFFYAIELVKDSETRATFDDECESLLRGFLSPVLFDAGLICRQDDRGDPVVQISPPLVAGEAEMDEIVGILGDVLTQSARRMLGTR